MYFQSDLTDKVHQPLTTVRVVPLYQICGRVAYLCVAFLPHIAKVCEKFVNFEWIFLYEPCMYKTLVFYKAIMCMVHYPVPANTVNVTGTEPCKEV